MSNLLATRPDTFKVLFAPFSKSDDDQRIVEGIASSEAVDSDGEVIEAEAMADALDDYMKFANLREMHGMSAAGKVQVAEMRMDGKKTWIRAKVVDDQAWLKVKEKVYMGFSIGGKVTKREGKVIKGLKLFEISLVDRPANPEALIEIWKRAGDVNLSADDVKDILAMLDFHKTHFVPSTSGERMIVNKSLSHVGWLANLLDSLIYLYENVEAEQVREGDEASTLCANLAGVLNVLGDTLEDMVIEEVGEEKARLDIVAATAKAIMKSASRVQKGEAAATREEVYTEIDGMKGKLNAMHKAVSDAADDDINMHMDHIKTIHKAHDDFAGNDSTKEDAVSVETLKNLKALLAKREAKKAEAVKAAGAQDAAGAESAATEIPEVETVMKAQVEILEGMENITKSIDELKASIKPGKAVVTTVTKGQDGGEGADGAGAQPEVLKISRKLPEREREMRATKAAQKGLKFEYVD